MDISTSFAAADACSFLDLFSLSLSSSSSLPLSRAHRKQKLSPSLKHLNNNNKSKTKKQDDAQAKVQGPEKGQGAPQEAGEAGEEGRGDGPLAPQEEAARRRDPGRVAAQGGAEQGDRVPQAEGPGGRGREEGGSRQGPRGQTERGRGRRGRRGRERRRRPGPGLALPGPFLFREDQRRLPPRLRLRARQSHRRLRHRPPGPRREGPGELPLPGARARRAPLGRGHGRRAQGARLLVEQSGSCPSLRRCAPAALVGADAVGAHRGPAACVGECAGAK